MKRRLSSKIVQSFSVVKSVLGIPFYARIAWASALVYGLAFIFVSGTVFFANGGPFPSDPFFLPYLDSPFGPGIVWLVTPTVLISLTLGNAVTIIATSALIGLNVALTVYNLGINRERVRAGGSFLPGAVLGLFSTASCCIPSAATWFVVAGLVSVGNFFYSYYYVIAPVAVAVLLATNYRVTRQISNCKLACRIKT